MTTSSRAKLRPTSVALSIETSVEQQVSAAVLFSHLGLGVTMQPA
jgi:hypothetical protein